MQCYQYLAAITAVSNTIDNLPGTRHKMPHSVIANWMEENGIEAEDILQRSRPSSWTWSSTTSRRFRTRHNRFLKLADCPHNRAAGGDTVIGT
jgi:hypothetical protein